MSAPERHNPRERAFERARLDLTLETEEQITNTLERQLKSSIKSAPPSDIEVLRAQVRQVEEWRRRVTTALPFGLAENDARLPGGGSALGALHDVAGGGNGAIDGAAAALFVAGIAARTKSPVVSRPARSLRRSPRSGRPEIGPVIYLKGDDEEDGPRLL
jgi:hypothetical protein